jgi:hypothetical protein
MGRPSAGLNKRLLQVTVAVLALIPTLAGGAGVLKGPALVLRAGDWPINLDSHFRFLSAIFLAVGLTFYAAIPDIERKTSLFRWAAFLVFAGGLGRALSLVSAGVPGTQHVLGLGMELVVVPLLVAWQAAVARSARPR